MKSQLARRCIAIAVSISLVINPSVIAQPLPQVIIDNSQGANTGLKESSNGTQVVDIAAPSAGGVSHNRYREFNVNEQGLILNNSLAPVLTQLGGWTDGNRRLAGGEASIILNEVTGLSRSNLLGHIEIAGRSAEFVLANANGITCAGCGFINTPRVTLVTGKPELQGGALSGFNVFGGDVRIEGEGLDASNVDRFDIVTRAAQINAELYARDLRILTGTNHLDYGSGELTTREAVDNPAFQFALDASSLGAMYANSIQLIGTEKGLGVNSEGLIHSIDDLEITADGDIRLRNTQSNAHLNVVSQSGAVTLDERTYAKSLALDAATLVTNQGLLGASETIGIQAERFEQQGSLYAGLSHDGALLESGRLQTNLQQDFRNAGDIYVGGEFAVDASELNNTDGVINLATQEALTVDGNVVNERGILAFAADNVQISVASLDNTEGQITHTGEGQLSLAADQALINTQGSIATLSSLSIEAEHLGNNSGILLADTASVQARAIDNTDGVIDAQQLALDAAQITNLNGEILARSNTQNALVLRISDTLNNQAGFIYTQASDINLQLDQLLNLDGQIFAGTGSIQVIANHLSNQGGILDGAQLLLAADTLDNSQGQLFAQQLALDTETLTNHDGHIQADNIAINTGDYLSRGGVLLALGGEGESLSLIANQVQNSQGAIIESRGEHLNLDVRQLDNTGGNLLLTGQGQLELLLDQLINRDGKIHSAQQLQITGGHLDNQSGQLSAGQSLVLRAQQIENSNGVLSGGQQMAVQAQRLDNTQGLIQGREVNLHLDRVTNRQGDILALAGGSLDLHLRRDLDNREGNVMSQGQLVLRATNIDNTAGTIEGKNLQLTLDRLINNRGLIQGDELSLSIPELDNRGGTIAAVNRNGRGLALQVTGLVDNTGGRLISQGRDFMLNASEVRNQDGELLAQQNLELNAQVFDNTRGLVSGHHLVLRTTDINNLQAGVIEGEQLSLHADTLNNEGLVLATGTEAQSLGLNLLRINNSGRIETYSLDLLLDNIALNSDGGEIVHQGEGVLRVQAEGTFDNRGGALITRGQLDFQAEAVDNRGGQLIAAGHLAIDINAIQNQGGLIQSGDGLNLNLTEFDNSNNGKVIVGGSLPAQIRVDGLFNNASGAVIYWGQDLLSIIAEALDNSTQGTLGGDGALAVQVAGVLDNTGGHIISGSQVNLDAGGLLNRSEGFIEAESLNLRVDHFENHNSRLQADSLAIEARVLDNRNGGEIIALGTNPASIQAEQVTNQGALIYAAQDLSIQTDNLQNEGGDIEAAILDIQSSSFDNAGALYATTLNIDTQTLLNNTQGVIHAGQAQIRSNNLDNLGLLAAYAQERSGFALYADEFNNHGRLENQGQNLLVNIADQIVNTGEIVHLGQGELQLATSQLDNREGEILATRAMLAVQSLDNQEGILFAQDSLAINTQAVDNRDGLIQSGQFLALNATSLDNTQGGRVIADTSAIALDQLDNRAGLLAVGQLDLSADQLDNTEGQILVDRLNLELQQLDNTLGDIAATDDVTITASSLINQGGSIMAADRLILSADNLVNDEQEDVLGILSADWIELAFEQFENRAGGKLQGNQVRLEGEVIENDGLIASMSEEGESLQFIVNHIGNSGRIESQGEDLLFESLSVNNSSGEILHHGNGSLVMRLDQLVNEQGGVVQAQGSLVVEIDELNNTNGTLVALGSKSLVVNANELNNTRGLIQAENVQITANALNNTRGELSASQLTIAAWQLDNLGGFILADQLAIVANTLNNTLDDDREAYISATSVAINTETLNNNSIIDSRSDSIIEAGVLNNFDGVINAAGQLSISATDADNTLGLIRTTSTTDNALQLHLVNPLINAQGSIESYAQNLSLDQLNIDNRAGKFLHLGEGVLSINSDHYTHTGGLLYSAGDMHLNLRDSLINLGDLAAVGTIQIDTALFENRQNSLVDAGQLLLVADNTVNQARIQVQDMAVEGDWFDNRGGQLLISGEHQNALRLQLDEFDNRDRGRIEIQGGSLSLDTAINNQGGNILHLGEGVLRLTQVDNRDGEIYAVGDLEIEQETLDNSEGYVRAEGQLNLQVDSLINREGTFYGRFIDIVAHTLDNTAGQVLSEESLLLSLNQLVNRGEGDTVAVIAARDLSIIANDMDNRGGQLQASESLVLNLPTINNQGGRIVSLNTADQALSLITQYFDNRDGGRLEIYSQNVDISALPFDNQGGYLYHLGEGQLSIHNTERDLLNAGGNIQSLGDIDIQQRSVDNRDGFIQGNRVAIHAEETIDNSLEGQLLGQRLSLSANAFNNTQQGIVAGLGNYDDSLVFNVASLDNSGGTLRSGADNWSLNLNAFSNDGGSIIHTGNQQLSLSSDGVLNTAGSIISLANIHLSADGINNSGNVIAEGNLILDASEISNSAVVSAAHLEARNVNQLQNLVGGQIETGSLDLQGNTLTNQGSLVVANSGNSLDWNLASINNTGSMVIGSTDLSFSGDLTNSGSLTHAGTGTLLLGNSGSVNLQGGQIATAGTANLINSLTGAGDLFARLGIQIGGAGTFHNTGSNLYTQGYITINTALNNQGGSMIADGVLSVNTAGTINNSAGHLQGGSIQLNAGTLTNTTNGRVVATGTGSTSLVANHINNTGGSISVANNQFTLRANQGSVNNTGGTIFHRGNGTFTLTANDDVINASGANLTSLGTLTLTAADQLTNAGVLQANRLNVAAAQLHNSGDLFGFGEDSITTTNLVNTGLIKGEGANLTLNAANQLNNTGGTIEHVGPGTLLITAPSLLNATQQSVINGNGAVDIVTQGHFINSGEISSGYLTQILNLGALTNHHRITSRAGDVEVQMSGVLTNAGTISGLNKTDIEASSIGNTGSIQSDGLVELTLDALSQTGNVSAGSELRLNVTQSITINNDETLSTNGILSLNTQGDITNWGTLSAVDAIRLSGNHLYNHQTIQGGGVAAAEDGSGLSGLDFEGSITNNGRISASGDLAVQGSQFINQGTVASGGSLSFSVAGDIENHNNRVIFAGNNLVLGAGGTINNDGGTIFAVNDLWMLGQDIESNTSRSQGVINTNGQIEALGQLGIYTNQLSNIRTGVEYLQSPTTTTTTLAPNGFYSNGGTDEDGFGNVVTWTVTDRHETTHESTTFTPAAAGNDAKIASGGNMILDTNNGVLLNEYGSIASGAQLRIQGGTLDNRAYVEQRHEETTVVTRREYAYSASSEYFCNLRPCIEYLDESDGATYGSSKYEINYLSSAMGTISAVGDINGNLRGQLLTRVVSPLNGSLGGPQNPQWGNYAAQPVGEDTQGPGSTPSDANRGTDVAGGSGPSGSLNNQNGSAQNTNGQGLVHGGTFEGDDPDGPPMDPSQLYGVDGQGGPDELIAAGFDVETGSYNSAEADDLRRSPVGYIDPDTLIDLTPEQIAALTEAHRNQAQNTGTTTPDGRDAPIPADMDVASLQDGLKQHAPDMGALDENGERVSDGDGQLAGSSDMPTANTQAPASATTAETDPTPPEPYSVNLLPANLNPGQLSGLFVYNNAPSANYLIETRPEFTDYTRFLGSDYLLSALGYNPDKTLKRLGDAFYETQLIRDALRREVGTQYLAGAANDYDQMKALMDNAVAAGQSLQLRVGIALTPAQLAALTQDIVWLVEQVVNGQKVLVPTLYVASVVQNTLPGGALIAAGGGINLHAAEGANLQGQISAGKHLQLTTDGHFQVQQNAQLNAAQMYLESTAGNLDQYGQLSADLMSLNAAGDLNNHGSLQADSGLWVSAGDRLTNHSSGQMISGGVLSLTATNDLINRQGYLEGVNVSLTSKEGDIINRTEFDVIGDRSGTHSTRIGEASTIISHNSLSMDAGRNLDLQGSQFSAAGNISLNAGNDILLYAVEDSRAGRSEGKNYRLSYDITEWTGVSIAAGGDLSLTAGRDIQTQGTQLSAGGNASLHAERDLNLVAVNDSRYISSYQRTDRSFGRSRTTETESLHSTNVGTVVQAGGDITLNATLGEDGSVGLKDSRNVLIHGSLLDAGGSVVVGAGENITVTANQEEHLDYRMTSRSGLGGMTGRMRSDTEAAIIQVGSLTNAGEDVVMLAGKDLTIAGSTVNAGNHAELYAGLTHEEGNLNILALEDQFFSESLSKKKSLTLDFSSDSVSFSDQRTLSQDTTQTGNAASYVLAGSGNIVGEAAQDITLTGSVMHAGDTVTLDAGRNITVQSGTSSDSLGDEESRRRGMLSWGGDDNSINVFAGHETLGTRVQQDVEGVAASQIVGKDIQATAGNDINIVGSDLDAERSIRLTADNDVNILASHESVTTSTQDSFTRDGLTLTFNHNLGNAADAIGDLGSGDNAVSDASDVMQAMDAMNNIGPSGSAFLGQTTTSNTHQSQSTQARGSSLNAGEDVTIEAGNNATIAGSQVNAGRNIRVDANDIVVTTAENTHTLNDITEYQQVGATLSGNQSGASLTVGFAQSESDYEQQQITTTGSALNAGQDINLNARNDLTIEGSALNAERNIGLDAGNNLTITAGQDHTRSTLDEEHLSAGAGVALTASGIGFTAYVAAGENDLDRQNINHQNASITAGQNLSITSGKDTSIAGANLHASEVDMDVGGDLTLASLQDTGSVEGRRWDASASITVGMGVSASVNVGYGETEGSSAWVNQQTSIIGSESVNIKVGGHTQVDGALIANIDEEGNDQGNLSLDTRTFGFTDLEDHHEEESYYLSVGIGVNGGSGAETAQKNPNAEGDSWSVSGNYYDLDRQQTTSATVGQGTIRIRSDEENGTDSLAGLNRDTEQAQTIIKDEETEFDLYVSSTAIDSVDGLFEEDKAGNNVTLSQWQGQFSNFGRNTVLTYQNIDKLANHEQTPAFFQSLAGFMIEAGDLMGTLTLGLAPGVENYGGLAGGIAGIAAGDQFFYAVQTQTSVDAKNNFVLENHFILDEVDSPLADQTVFTNGIQNSLEEAIRNGAMQTGSNEFVMAYNPEHGLLGDLFESFWDKNLGGIRPTGNASQLNSFFSAGIQSNTNFNIAAHSQGTLLNYRAMEGLDFTNGGTKEAGTIQFSGSPLNATQFQGLVENTGFAAINPNTGKFDYSNTIFQINRPVGEASLFGFALVDSVADMPVFLGGNHEHGEGGTLGGAIFSLPFLFGDKSPHSNYVCQTTACRETPSSAAVEEFRRNIRTPTTEGRGYINPTIIDMPVKPPIKANTTQGVQP